jgi:hypothetical protein
MSKDKQGIVTPEQLTRHWTDWIDYWAVDFDFESKREIIRVPREAPVGWASPTSAAGGGSGAEAVGDAHPTAWEEKWTGDYIFENEWQSFRTRKDRTLELRSIFHEYPNSKARKRRKIAVKVVDIFGNDTMTIVDIALGEAKKPNV